MPAARYVHPCALESPSESGSHGANLAEAADSAANYLTWISDLLQPHLGRTVLDVGAGLGAVTEHYAAGREVLAAEISDEFVPELRRRFAGWPNVTVVQRDARDLRQASRRFDSVVLVNVLEHIADDAGLLASLAELTTPQGNIVIYVPALNGVYGTWDRQVGHYRRYSKWRLKAVAREAGLRIEELRYVNLLALPGWLLFSRTQAHESTDSSLSLWDRTGIPLTRAIETRVRIPIGLNLLMVMRRDA